MSLRDLKTAQKLFDVIPGLIDRKKVAGKDLPTEVYIKKKRMLQQKINIIYY